MSKGQQTIKGAEKTSTLYQAAAKQKKTQPTTSEAERIQRKAAGKTQGRTGCKADRINLAFTVENYEFVKRFCKLRGLNMTEFVNHIIDDYRNQHIKEFEEFEKFLQKT